MPFADNLIAFTFAAMVLRTSTVEGRQQGVRAALGINAVGLLWSMVLIGATQSLAGVLRRKQVIQWMDRATRMVFVLFAARLALSRR